MVSSLMSAESRVPSWTSTVVTELSPISSEDTALVPMSSELTVPDLMSIDFTELFFSLFEVTALLASFLVVTDPLAICGGGVGRPGRQRDDQGEVGDEVLAEVSEDHADQHKLRSWMGLVFVHVFE